MSCKSERMHELKCERESTERQFCFTRRRRSQQSTTTDDTQLLSLFHKLSLNSTQAPSHRRDRRRDLAGNDCSPGCRGKKIERVFSRERKEEFLNRLARFSSRRHQKIALSSSSQPRPLSLSLSINNKTTTAPRPLRPLPDGKPPRRGSPYRALQLPLRQERRRQAHPPRRGHRRRALDERV